MVRICTDLFPISDPVFFRAIRIIRILFYLYRSGDRLFDPIPFYLKSDSRRF